MVGLPVGPVGRPGSNEANATWRLRLLTRDFSRKDADYRVGAGEWRDAVLPMEHGKVARRQRMQLMQLFESTRTQMRRETKLIQ
jgi:hypothetical protein